MILTDGAAVGDRHSQAGSSRTAMLCVFAQQALNVAIRKEATQQICILPLPRLIVNPRLRQLSCCPVARHRVGGRSHSGWEGGVAWIPGAESLAGSLRARRNTLTPRAGITQPQGAIARVSLSGSLSTEEKKLLSVRTKRSVRAVERVEAITTTINVVGAKFVSPGASIMRQARDVRLETPGRSPTCLGFE